MPPRIQLKYRVSVNYGNQPLGKAFGHAFSRTDVPYINLTTHVRRARFLPRRANLISADQCSTFYSLINSLNVCIVTKCYRSANLWKYKQYVLWWRSESTCTGGKLSNKVYKHDVSTNLRFYSYLGKAVYIFLQKRQKTCVIIKQDQTIHY